MLNNRNIRLISADAPAPAKAEIQELQPWKSRERRAKSAFFPTEIVSTTNLKTLVNCEFNKLPGAS
jgi:hypothetical protein